MISAEAEDYLSGMTLQEVGDKYGISYGAVRNRLLKEEVKLRPPGVPAAPDAKERRKSWLKSWRQTPERKAQEREYDSRPEVRMRRASLKYNVDVNVLPSEFCDACGKSEKEHYRLLGMDHCHATNRFRGWLCDSCNLILGHANDNIEHLRSIIRYLEKTS